jgi:transcription elongation factor SPT6
MRDDEEVARPNRSRLPDLGVAADAGLDEAALEDFRAAFGDGNDYWFALEKEDEADDREAEKDKHLNLKDVFEPSQLQEKMLTDEDNEIRFTDEPERFQLARKPYRYVTLTEEQFKEEPGWISDLMLPKAKLAQHLHEPFRRAVAKVLEFMVTDDYEVPFIFQNRKDYLIHAERKNVGYEDDGTPRYEIEASKLLVQSDLWNIFDLDLKFRGLIDKRTSLQATYDSLISSSVAPDGIFEKMLPQAATMEELQDVQDYLYFQYASQLKDLATTGNGDVNGVGMSRKKAATRTIYEQVRNGRLYGLVRAFGITADAFAENALNLGGARNYADDPLDTPENMADTFIDEEFATGTQAFRAAKAMFVEELAVSPKMRKVVRKNIYQTGVIDCFRTEKGLRKIDEQHPYYDFKYLRNQEFGAIAGQPELYLRMLKAEEDGLIEVKVRNQNIEAFKKLLYRHIVSDNYSEVADAWNRERKDVVDAALAKILNLMARTVKENLKNECESAVAKGVREEFSRRLDQAPYQPKGMKKGTIPRVLAISNGAGISGRDAICWAWVSEEGRVLENGKFVDLAPGDKERGLPDGKDVDAFAELVRRREPDVIGISGFSPETRKLYNQLTTIVKDKDLRGAIYEDEDGRDKSDFLDVVIVNDEIARLYQSSDRAKLEHPSFAPLTNYCVALARYMQDPLKEYAALGSDITSIAFTTGQQLLPQDKVKQVLEFVLVDYVNMCGVELNDAAQDSAIANLLPYVAGLGPRKANQLLKVINLNGGTVATREELLGVNNTHAAMGIKVWNNSASTLYLDYDPTEPESEYLDNTRIHPEDYDIARKMAADALELDEEDIKAEVDENGTGAIIRKLIKDDAQERVNDLILEEYAEQLERNLNQRKRATLENIRAELIEPYEELRQPFITSMPSEDVFTMFTGETRETLERGMIVPISIKRITDDHIDGKLDCGIDAFVGETDLTDRFDVSVKQLYSVHQTVQAKILQLDRKHFTATCSLREDQLKRPYRKFHDRQYDEWDDREEAADKKLLEEKTDAGGRATRVIKHPLFRAFNAAQAEEYLGSQNPGDVVIRPSSKGVDHLAVTWKVADGIFQHIDVLEMDKENEFALGKTLKIAGRYTYSDLDELIVLHVKAMAKKVDEMMTHEKFQRGSKADIGKIEHRHLHKVLLANASTRTVVDHLH